MNKHLEAAQNAVPEIVDYERRKALVDAKLSELPSTGSPDDAARAVAADAVNTYLDTGKWPADAEERARAAYTDAVAADAIAGELVSLRSQFVSGHELKRIVLSHAPEILVHLDGQLQNVLEAVRKELGALGGVRTAEDAVNASRAALEAYRRVVALVPELSGIREAAWTMLARTVDITGPASPLAHAKRDGWGHVRGTAVPDAHVDDVAAGRFTLDHLVWLAQEPDSHVPTDASEFIEARQARRAALTDDGSTPREDNPYGDAPLIIDMTTVRSRNE
ncbi:hypothetical protein [Streptomyces gibsoniae]|uniref:HNH endonuclease n=1 Tax=Streptomyces gibsoniae TaxID=3075529 RepID=A0ABU2U9K3_9ACTN|nr:hypothetical protein [Streptomyces sp. DSM 41699]MDT0469923.1 hypothetical protein [Streptomyces sp. DSM 41699]